MQLTFEDARVTGLQTSPTNDEPRESLTIEVGVTPEIADEFGVKDMVYGTENTVRPGWKKLSLTAVLNNVRFHTPAEHNGESLSFAPKKISGFAMAFSKGGALKMTFNVSTDGYAEVLAAFLTAVGTGPFRLEIEPLQIELPMAAEGEAAAEEEKAPWEKEGATA
jgi:hypothetical protein